MNTKEYVRELLELNIDDIKGRQNNCYYANISHGLAEELLELATAKDDDDIAKELGDVFAYAVLLMLSAELENLVHMLATNSTDSIVTFVADDLDFALANADGGEDLVDLALIVQSSFKRYFRGEGNVSSHLIAEVAALAAANYNYPLRQVLDINIEKLKSRKERGLLNKGKGNNR